MIAKESATEFGDLPSRFLSGCAASEHNSVQSLGSSGNTLISLGKLSDREYLLNIMTSGDAGVSDCEAIENAETVFCGHQNILLQELGTYRHRLRAQANVVNNAESNVAVGTV